MYLVVLLLLLHSELVVLRAEGFVLLLHPLELLVEVVVRVAHALPQVFLGRLE